MVSCTSENNLNLRTKSTKDVLEPSESPDIMLIQWVVPIYKSVNLHQKKIIASVYYQLSKKLWKKIVCNSLTNYLEHNNVIYLHQYGFRKNPSNYPSNYILSQ